MSTFKELKSKGLIFANATVGHLPAERVVTQAVLMTGRLPKQLPWQDRILKDTNGILGTRNAIVSVSALPASSLKKMFAPFSSDALLTQIKNHRKGDGKNYVIAEPKLQTAALGGDWAETKSATQPLDTLLEVLNNVQDWAAIVVFCGGLNPANSQSVDLRLNNILRTLEQKHLLDDLLLVVTASNGVSPAEAKHHGSEALQPLLKTGLVAAHLEDSAVRLWLKNTQPETFSKLSAIARELPGVAEVYARSQTGSQAHYIRHYRNPKIAPAALPWIKNEHPKLLETMAGAGSADLVALLMNDDTYGDPIDGTGAQESIQRIPLLLVAPNLLIKKNTAVIEGARSDSAVTFVDISAMVLRIMGIAQPAAYDGSCHAVTDWLPPEE